MAMAESSSVWRLIGTKNPARSGTIWHLSSENLLHRACSGAGLTPSLHAVFALLQCSIMMQATQLTDYMLVC